MKGLKIISGVLAICVTMPIWYFLLYRILTAVDASELMWFLYWIYLPTALIVQVLSKIVESDKL